MGMRFQKGCKGPPPQTVRKLLEQRRQQQAALNHSTGPLIPPGALEASWPEPHGTIEKGVPALGQTAAPQYPVAAFAAWQTDASSHGAFSSDFHYPCVDPGNDFHLQPQGSQYDVMSPCPPLETNIYGTVGPGGPEEGYTSKITSAVNYEKVATEAVHLYPSSANSWLGQEQNNASFLLPGSYADLSVDVDPGELTQARAQIQNIDLSHLLQQDEDGDTLLHLFVAQGLRPLSYAAAEMLRDCGQLDVKEHRGKTPLLVAAAANQSKIVKDLVLLGADVNAMDQKGQTVLHLGATYGLPSVIEAVMMTGALVNVEARNFEGLTPLHCAVVAHNAAFQIQNMEPSSQHHLQNLLLCIQRLLQLGADYKSQELKSSKTILHLAVQAANLPLVQFLLKLPGQERQNFVNIKAHGNTALHMAAGLHDHPYQEQIVRLLLDHWADPSARNPENEQPVHLLTSGPAAEQLRLLLRSRRSGPGLVYPPSFT
ncbi:NF-kappa-B inhibitor delta isoform X1 [Crotalus tigris]|uniref:NF-kappa-B inhibitor delta isoform X1 n=1 Tax=Crotalus tigris TaxID=88082 RepID=UPI00192F7AD3|nr:NF-kappa-B inhibitor delta isoform X1 [Crotalus tigris]